MVDRKIFAMHKRFGECGSCRCKDCSHLISGKYHDRTYHKCELYGLSHGESTDWRLSYVACGQFNAEIDLDLWRPVIEVLKSLPRPVLDPPLNGQMKREV